MDLMEYRARELFEKYGIPVPAGVIVDNVDEAVAVCQEMSYPLVVKAQVQVGGRGKAGGVKFAENEEELRSCVQTILGMDIKGHIVHRVLVVAKAEIQQEFYLSIMLDRFTKSPLIIFSAHGGMDIEQVAHEMPDQVVRLPIDPLLGVQDYHARYLLTRVGLSQNLSKSFYAFLSKLYAMFRGTDATLAEINPLAVLDDGSLLAADGKVSIDDSALYRQSEVSAFRDELPEDELVREARLNNFLYVPCESNGTVAVMSNGSGMVMTSMDLIAAQGIKTGVAFDLGGGATGERIAKAVRIVLKNPHIRLLFITIFGGITRCDEVAKGIRLALSEDACRARVIVRFEGTNKEEGLEILSTLPEGSVIYADSILEGVGRLVVMKEDLL